MLRKKKNLRKKDLRLFKLDVVKRKRRTEGYFPRNPIDSTEGSSATIDLLRP